MIIKYNFLIYGRPDFDQLIVVPNLNVTLSFDLHFIVVKSGLRADLNACDLHVLLVGDIYSLETLESRVPLWTTLYSLPKTPVIYPWPILPRGPRKWTTSPGSQGKLSPNVEGGCLARLLFIPDVNPFKLRANFELSLSDTW
jgi:hypothetical protein